MYQIYSLFRETITEFGKYNISQMAASLAYFGLFATAPIILITITILNIFLSDTQIRYIIINEVNTAAGPQIANTIGTILLNNASSPSRNLLFETITLITLLLAATTLVIQFKNVIHTLWNIKETHRDSFLHALYMRAISLIIIICGSISIYIFFILSIALQLLEVYIEQSTGYHSWTLKNINFIISFFFIITILAALFKYVPDAVITWRDALVGGAVTAGIFTIAQYLLTIYFNRNIIGSVYGTAGFLLVFLAWIYFSALIFMFGAKFTQLYAIKMGSGISQ